MSTWCSWMMDDSPSITDLFLGELVREFGLRKTYKLWKEIRKKPTFENLKKVLSNARK